MAFIAGAIIGGAILGAGTAIYSASKAGSAAKSAAKVQAQATDKATEAQLEMYYQSRKDVAPWREAGGEAITTALDVVKDPSKYVESPYYNFLLDQGTKARARSASAKGTVDSGRAIIEAEKFGQGLASTDYGNYINYLLDIAGMGRGSAEKTADLATVTGNNIANNEINAGNARASGYINQVNAVTGGVTGVANAINTGVNNYLFYDYLKETPPAKNNTLSYLP